MDKDTKTLSLEEINKLLSDALMKVSTRKISLKQAGAISKIALSLTKNIAMVDLKHKVEFLEQALKAKR